MKAIRLLLIAMAATAAVAADSTALERSHDKIKIKVPKGKIKGLEKFPLGMYPLWHVHKYKGISLRPVPIGEAAMPPPSMVAPSPSYEAPSYGPAPSYNAAPPVSSYGPPPASISSDSSLPPYGAPPAPPAIPASASSPDVYSGSSPSANAAYTPAVMPTVSPGPIYAPPPSDSYMGPASPAGSYSPNTNQGVKFSSSLGPVPQITASGGSPGSTYGPPGPSPPLSGPMLGYSVPNSPPSPGATYLPVQTAPIAPANYMAPEARPLQSGSESSAPSYGDSMPVASSAMYQGLGRDSYRPSIPSGSPDSVYRPFPASDSYRPQVKGPVYTSISELPLEAPAYVGPLPPTGLPPAAISEPHAPTYGQPPTSLAGQSMTSFGEPYRTGPSTSGPSYGSPQPAYNGPNPTIPGFGDQYNSPPVMPKQNGSPQVAQHSGFIAGQVPSSHNMATQSYGPLNDQASSSFNGGSLMSYNKPMMLPTEYYGAAQSPMAYDLSPSSMWQESSQQPADMFASGQQPPYSGFSTANEFQGPEVPFYGPAMPTNYDSSLPALSESTYSPVDYSTGSFDAPSDVQQEYGRNVMPVSSMDHAALGPLDTYGSTAMTY